MVVSGFGQSIDLAGDRRLGTARTFDELRNAEVPLGFQMVAPRICSWVSLGKIGASRGGAVLAQQNRERADPVVRRGGTEGTLLVLYRYLTYR